jgi:hypothetical protein
MPESWMRARAEQVGHLGSPSSRRILDAYLADEEVIENELQTVAASIRTARPFEGFLSDPTSLDTTSHNA